MVKITMEDAPFLEARIFAYGLLSQAFIEEPTRDFLKTLSADDVLRSFPFASDDGLILEGVNRVAEYLGKPDSLNDELYDKIHWDYTRMFIGPDKLPAPPWESVYLSKDHLLFQEETLAVRRAYLRYGLLPQNYPHEADDHLGLELDFMCHLSKMTRDKVASGAEGLTGLLEDQKEFLEKHLLRWVPALTSDIIKSAHTGFYKGLAQILRGYLPKDLELVEGLLEEVKEKRG